MIFHSSLHKQRLWNLLKRFQFDEKQHLMYIQEPKIVGVFVSDVQASGFWALGGLEHSKIVFGWASGRS